MPGVLAVYTSADLGSRRCRASSCCPPAFNRPAARRRAVRFVGDIVAAVVAETRAQAVDAAEMVVVDYDPLPDGRRRRGGARRRTRRSCSPSTARTSAIAIRLRRRRPRARRRRRRGHGPVRQPAARRGADGAERDPGRARRRGRLTVYGPDAGAVRRARRARARSSGSSPSTVRVVAPAVGGGFGAKTGVYCEHVVAGPRRTAARPAGEVDRDPLREHGRA